MAACTIGTRESPSYTSLRSPTKSKSIIDLSGNVNNNLPGANSADLEPAAEARISLHSQPSQRFSKLPFIATHRFLENFSPDIVSRAISISSLGRPIILSRTQPPATRIVTPKGPAYSLNLSNNTSSYGRSIIFCCLVNLLPLLT